MVTSGSLVVPSILMVVPVPLVVVLVGYGGAATNGGKSMASKTSLANPAWCGSSRSTLFKSACTCSGLTLPNSASEMGKQDVFNVN